MRSNALFLTIGLFAAGCAHAPAVPDVIVSPPAPAPAMTTSAVVVSPETHPSAASPAPEVQDSPVTGQKTADADASSTTSRNARSAAPAQPTDTDPPFVERAAVEALDRIAYLFHVEADGSCKKLTLATDTLFAPGSDVLDPTTSSVRLQGLATALKAQGPHPIRIESFTDALGDPEENRTLSERRANALRDYFVSQGVRSDRLIAEGRGATHPVASNATPDGRAINRRVEIVIESAGTGRRR